MTRITITLSDGRYAALKEAAARRRRTIGRLVEDALELYGVKSTAEAAELVARARRTAAMTEADALGLGVAETREHRWR
jgi:prephenate dehydratase